MFLRNNLLKQLLYCLLILMFISSIFYYISMSDDEDLIGRRNRAFAILTRISEIAELEKRYKDGFLSFPSMGHYASIETLKQSGMWNGPPPKIEEYAGYRITVILRHDATYDIQGSLAYYAIAVPNGTLKVLPFGFIMDHAGQKWKYKLTKDTREIEKREYSIIANFIQSLPVFSKLKNDHDILTCDLHLEVDSENGK